MSGKFYVGLDLGQRQDHTALAVLERVEAVYPEVDPVTYARRKDVEYRLRHMERAPLGVGYVEIMRYVRQLMQERELAGRSVLVADASGVGAPVVEMLRREMAGCPVEAVTITSGRKSRADEMGWLTPRRELVEELALLLERGELQIARGCGELGRLREELRNLRVRMGAGGVERYVGEQTGVHEDLVMAVALAAWKAKAGNRTLFGMRRLV